MTPKEKRDVADAIDRVSKELHAKFPDTVFVFVAGDDSNGVAVPNGEETASLISVAMVNVDAYGAAIFLDHVGLECWARTEWVLRKVDEKPEAVRDGQKEG